MPGSDPKFTSFLRSLDISVTGALESAATEYIPWALKERHSAAKTGL